LSRIGKIEKKIGNRYLSYYELEAIHRDGSASPYYMASRTADPAALTAVTNEIHPNGVTIYSLLGDRVVLIRQYRYPIGGYVYEFPAGLVEPGENVADAAVREMYEETGLQLSLIPSGFSRPFFTTDGMTDESCCLVFGHCTGSPTSEHEEESEDIQVILADKAECRRILSEEKVSIQCAYMLMHFIASEGDPFAFLSGGKNV
jgi:ADP-ribose pyrophosphatase